MVRLVDVPLDGGSTKGAIDSLNALALESQEQTTRQEVPQNPQSVGDQRFAGKSTEEIVNMYRNLESHSGRLASQLGEARSSLQSVIAGKRENDLQRQGVQEPAKIQASDLLSNPTDAIDRYLQSKQNPEVNALQARLNALENQLATTTLNFKHPKAEEITADPKFAAWVRQTPLRSNLAQNAANGDPRAAEMLLSEYQASIGDGTNAVENAAERARALVGKTGLEGRASGSESTGRTKKMLKSSDLVALRMNNPDEYERRANEITQAYIEKRVLLNQ